MSARFNTLLIASQNIGKIKEMRDILAPHIPDLRDAVTLDLPDVEETGETLEENALLKARAAVVTTGLPSLADDSGVYLDCFPEELGVKTKRWTDANGGFPDVFKTVLSAAHRTGQRGMRYACVLAIVTPQGHEVTVRGEVLGQMAWQADAHPSHGFGYDPLFIPEGYDRPFSALPPDIKRQVSHRSCALARLVKSWE